MSSSHSVLVLSSSGLFERDSRAHRTGNNCHIFLVDFDLVTTKRSSQELLRLKEIFPSKIQYSSPRKNSTDSWTARVGVKAKEVICTDAIRLLRTSLPIIYLSVRETTFSLTCSSIKRHLPLQPPLASCWRLLRATCRLSLPNYGSRLRDTSLSSSSYLPFPFLL